MTKSVTLEEASGHLGELIDLAEQGEEIVIIKNARSKAKLVMIPQPLRKRLFGQHAGQSHMSEDFDAPLPDDFWNGPMS